MRTVYARVAKITNAAGRHKYLTSADKQEEVVLHHEVMLHSWEEHSLFEKENQKSREKNNEALEVHVALPNELYEDQYRLATVCDELACEIVGPNKDYEWAVHWNKSRTNLHVHIMFSERENVTELEPKIYKKDIWHDKETHKLAKANSPNAILVHRKGEVQLDAEGNIKYNQTLFKTKDKKFIQRGWIQVKNMVVQNVFYRHGIEYDLKDNASPFLSQKKLYKGASEDYLQEAKEWNRLVRDYNFGKRIDLEERDTFQERLNSIEDKMYIEQSVKECSRAYGKFKVPEETKAFLKEQIRGYRMWFGKLYAKFVDKGQNLAKPTQRKSRDYDMEL